MASSIVHQLGHCAAGAAIGWRCVGYGFGPIGFVREGPGWRRILGPIRWGAWTRQVPASFDGFRREMIIILAGGAAGSLVFAQLFAAIALVTSNPAGFTLFTVLAVTTTVAALELVPIWNSSHGHRLLVVHHGGPPVDAMIRDMLAESSNFTPLRLRDWPHGLIERLAETNDPYNLCLAYLHALDAEETRAASAYMKRLIALLPAVDPHPHLAAEAAYWLATYGFDPRGARKWMDRAGSGAGRGVLLRAEAAVSLAEGQADRATALVNEGLSRIRRPTATGSDDFEVRRLRHLLAGVAAHSTEVKARLAETGFSYFLKP